MGSNQTIRVNKNFRRLAIATITAGSIFFVQSAFAATATVDLGTSSTYAVLGGTSVTNIGATTFAGTAGSDLGVSPGTSITGEGPGADAITKEGVTNNANAAAGQAQIDLTAAYDDAAGRTPVTVPAGGTLGGLTLTTGIYKATSDFGLTGTLTLDAQDDPSAVFIFQTVAALTTATNSTVALINGAQACNVFWQIGSSATIETGSVFVGHVMALTSISAKTGATIDGSLLARNGAVTLDNNTITNDECAAVVTPSESPTPEQTGTETGGELPDTGETPWGIVAALGGATAIAIGTGVRSRKHRG